MKKALEELHGSIPPFASWQIANLEQVFEQYTGILERLTQTDTYAMRCKPLAENASLIAWLIADCKSTASPVSYDRAAMELTWDIEALIEMLNR